MYIFFNKNYNRFFTFNIQGVLKLCVGNVKAGGEDLHKQIWLHKQVFIFIYFYYRKKGILLKI